MNDTDQDAFDKLMTVAFRAYRIDRDTEMIDLYFGLLHEYTLETVAIAIKHHMVDPDHGMFWPKPSDLIRATQGGTGTRALRAWDAAVAAIGTVGCYETVTFDEDPLILAVVDRMGGWTKFCVMTEDDRPFVQREFVQRYQAYLARPPADVPASLPGISETANMASQWRADPRTLRTAKPTRVGEGYARRPLPATPECPAIGDGNAENGANRPKALPAGKLVGDFLPLGSAMRRAVEGAKKREDSAADVVAATDRRRAIAAWVAEQDATPDAQRGPAAIVDADRVRAEMKARAGG